MAFQGFRWYTIGAGRTSVESPSPNLTGGRAELEANVAEWPVEQVSAGRFQGAAAPVIFGSPALDQILGGYITAETANIPAMHGASFTAGGHGLIMLGNLLAPVASAAGTGDDGRPRGTVNFKMDTRVPVDGSVLLASSAGITGNTNGAGVSLGAIAAIEEFVGGLAVTQFPTMAGGAVATFTLQHSAVVSSVTLDAGPAVDNGGGLVGLPSTGHGFVSGDVVRVIGTTNYEGENFTLDPTTGVNELVITATYVAETFAGTETADDLWDSPTTATVTTGTNPWTMTAGTAGYMAWTIDGSTDPVTDTEWRIIAGTVTSTVWPLSVGGKYLKP